MVSGEGEGGAGVEEERGVCGCYEGDGEGLLFALEEGQEGDGHRAAHRPLL